MSHDHSPEAVKKEVRVYLGVFGALLVGTVVTVAASYLNVSTALGIFIALVIATVKGSLVACFFMHLRSEKIMIFASLLLMLVFFVVLMILPIAMQMDTLTDNISSP